MKWIIENKEILTRVDYNVSDATAFSDFVWINSKIKTLPYHINKKTPMEIFFTPVKSLQPSTPLKNSLLKLYESQETS